MAEADYCQHRSDGGCCPACLLELLESSSRDAERIKALEAVLTVLTKYVAGNPVTRAEVDAVKAAWPALGLPAL